MADELARLEAELARYDDAIARIGRERARTADRVTELRAERYCERARTLWVDKARREYRKELAEERKEKRKC